MTPMDAAEETDRSEVGEIEDRLGAVGAETGSRLERMGLGRTVGGVLLVVAGVLVLVRPELLTLVVGIGAILLGVLAVATADEDATS